MCIYIYIYIYMYTYIYSYTVIEFPSFGCSWNLELDENLTLSESLLVFPSSLHKEDHIFASSPPISKAFQDLRQQLGIAGQLGEDLPNQCGTHWPHRRRSFCKWFLTAQVSSTQSTAWAMKQTWIKTSDRLGPLYWVAVMSCPKCSKSRKLKNCSNLFQWTSPAWQVDSTKSYPSHPWWDPSTMTHGEMPSSEHSDGVVELWSILKH